MPEVKAKLIMKKDTVQVTETFKKREFAIETIEQFPQKLPMQLSQDKTSLLDNIQVGAEITVAYNVRGKEYSKPLEETKYFVTLDAWKIQ